MNLHECDRPPVARYREGEAWVCYGQHCDTVWKVVDGDWSRAPATMENLYASLDASARLRGPHARHTI